MSGYYWHDEEVQAKLKAIMESAFGKVESIKNKYNCSYREAAFIAALTRLKNLIELRGILN
jgi:glutamate dehydrogenase